MIATMASYPHVVTMPTNQWDVTTASSPVYVETVPLTSAPETGVPHLPSTPAIMPSEPTSAEGLPAPVRTVNNDDVGSLTQPGPGISAVMTVQPQTIFHQYLPPPYSLEDPAKGIGCVFR